MPVVRYFSLAHLLECKLDRDFAIQRSPIGGKGLFALKDIDIGQIITAYDGERIHYEDAERRTRTHSLREKGSDFVYDGLSVTHSVRRRINANGQVIYQPHPTGKKFDGYASIANSATNKLSNCKLLWVWDDRGRRGPTYDPTSQTMPKNRNILYHQIAFLQAKKFIPKGTEITWTYQVEIDSDETESEGEFYDRQMRQGNLNLT